jgi:hypothetical protein
MGAKTLIFPHTHPLIFPQGNIFASLRLGERIEFLNWRKRPLVPFLKQLAGARLQRVPFLI